jgi:hypothetical protein
MLPYREGGMAFAEYDFMNQNRNWSGASSAPADDNPDKGSVGRQSVSIRRAGAGASHGSRPR